MGSVLVIILSISERLHIWSLEPAPWSQHDTRHIYGAMVVLYLFSTSNHNLILFAEHTILLSYSLFYIKPQRNGGCWCVRRVVLYLFSTSNHNTLPAILSRCKLSYISFLHQTTTALPQMRLTSCCLISLFYIKPQPSRILSAGILSCLISLFYIKPQPERRFPLLSGCCLISLFYIKPQHISYNLLLFRDLHYLTHIWSGWNCLYILQR